MEQTRTLAAAATVVHQLYQIFEWKHAETILIHQFPDAYCEVLNVLAQFRFSAGDILAPGGSKSPVSKGIETPLTALGWKRQEFQVTLSVNGAHRFSHTRAIDHMKGRIALEIEWNSKNSFFDRDLENFRWLYHLDLLSVGIIVTRSDSLRTIFHHLAQTQALHRTKYGTTTTQMSNIRQKIQMGGGAGCPLLVFGISEAVYVEKQEEEP